MNRTLAPLPARRMPTLPPIDSASRSSIRILVVDDERTLRESCHSVLEAEGYNVVVAGRGNEARDTLKRRPFDITLVDWFMGEVPGSELLRIALATNPGTIVIIMTGNPSVASSLEALQAGAWDYLPKPFSGTQLQILVGRAAHAVVVARESRALEEQRAQHPADGDRIAVLGDAPLFRKAIALARRVAATDASVFLTGESGAGKELFAQFIHDQDPDTRAGGRIDRGQRRHPPCREGGECADHGVGVEVCRWRIGPNPHVKVVTVLLQLVGRIYLMQAHLSRT